MRKKRRRPEKSYFKIVFLVTIALKWESKRDDRKGNATSQIATDSPGRQFTPSEGKQGRLRVLIFTRRIGEEIRIGDNIRVRIIDIKGKQVRLGIEAPPEVIIHREEIYLRINEKNAKTSEAGNEEEKLSGDILPKDVDQVD